MPKKFGSVSFSIHGHKAESVGLIGGEEVVRIRKNKTHTHTNSGIYTVFVRGVELPKTYRGIDEARLAGQLAVEDNRQT
ncbi:hypothetical protein HOY34_20560 [Xinfangfangia sp. D13-10-4-6]|uniref:hypothetical protein n=1 Tax=Pseudogemmobacter hezensis TaxID=2737662 RepID=UPI001555DFAD|nr:hypothetical protein [Pseudogemmobacter hezensis]NPD17581.1 hypothetical protein [Pseudogemmobacter hezensis]